MAAKHEEPREQSDQQLRWYVVQARTGKEAEVITHLKARIHAQRLEDRFGQILVPTEEVVEMRSGQKRKSQRKFFPGYVLVQIAMTDEIWHFVKDVPGVIGFIGGKKPAPISNQRADEILQRVEAGVGKEKPKTLYEPGEMIRVIDGPFTDFSGVVEDVNYDKNKLRVSVSIFGRATPVELDFGQVEKA